VNAGATPRSSTRILILDGDSTAGWAVLQSLGSAGYECWLAARGMDHPAFASRYVARALINPDPLIDKSAFQGWVLDIQRQHRFSLIIPPTESTLIPLHEVRDEPDLQGVLALPPARAVDVAFDKERVHAIAASLGIPSPANLLVSSLDDLAAPAIDDWLRDTAVVIKPIRSKVWSGGGASEQRVRIAKSRPELNALVEAILPRTPVQVQQWVPGKGVGIELLADHGEIVMSFAHERIHEIPLTGGGSSYRKSIAEPPALLEGSVKLMRELGWHGVAMVEYRADEASQRYWLMEINGRFWGSLQLALFAGVDFPRGLVDLLVHGRAPRATPSRKGVYARNVARDIDWTKAIARNRSDSRFLLTRPLPQSLLEWTRVLAGNETWDGARLRDPKPIFLEVTKKLKDEVRDVGRATRRFGLLHRERLLSSMRIKKIAGQRRILILCYGNICRSAYAGVTASARANKEITIRSSGFYSTAGRQTPDEFQGLTLRRGVDLSAHRSSRVDKADLDWSDLIVVMDQKNFEALRALDRGSLSKVVWLGAFDPSGPLEIEDPYELPTPEAEAILDRMDRCLDNLARRLTRKS
jgi:protein-tyrosine-phosphatase/predicted ATP-grasp superfamily ATP-dependent carboligase